jgi:hypothetical protein
MKISVTKFHGNPSSVRRTDTCGLVGRHEANRRAFRDCENVPENENFWCVSYAVWQQRAVCGTGVLLPASLPVVALALIVQFARN